MNQESRIGSFSLRERHRPHPFFHMGAEFLIPRFLHRDADCTGMTSELFQFLKPAASKQAEDQLAWSFCIPMNDMRVRQMLVNANAFDENNIVAERSYDDVFIQRYFDSYVVRESNKYNREISKYLTGQDAILESQMIENKIYEIESDMWEY